MKGLLILLLLLLCGCQAEPMPEPIDSEPIVQAEPMVILPEESPETKEPEVEAVDVLIKPTPVWQGSEPQVGAPIVPQPGDTAKTWNPSRADEFPADADCRPMELLEKWMAVEGLSWQDLDDRNCDQLVLAVANGEDGTTTRTNCYERKNGSWMPVEGLTNLSGYVGSRGIAHNRQRSSLQSPAGLWALGSAFGLAEEPTGLKLPWRQITDQSDWVTDDQSVYFNTWQERNDPAVAGSWNWNDTEHLADYTKTYTYACVIAYNTPPYVVPDRGCAIFLHVSDHPTEGCVALLENDMVKTLQWLDPHRNPHILVTGAETK